MPAVDDGPVLFDQDTATVRPGWSPELAGLVSEMVGYDVRIPNGWAAFALSVPGPWMAPVALLLDAAAGRLDGDHAPSAVETSAVITSLAPGIPNDKVTGFQLRTLLHRILPEEARTAAIRDAWAGSVDLRDELEYRADTWSSRVLRASLAAVLVSVLSLLCAGAFLRLGPAIVFALGGAAGLAAGLGGVLVTRAAARAVDDPRTGMDLWTTALTVCARIGDEPVLGTLDRTLDRRSTRVRWLREAALAGPDGPLRDLARTTRLHVLGPVGLASALWAVSVVVGWSML